MARNPSLRLLDGACLVLALVLVLQVLDLRRFETASETAASAGILGGGSEEAASAKGEPGPAAPESPEGFPERYEIIATSGILGKKPDEQPGTPELIGILGGPGAPYAVLRPRGGKPFLLSEGEERDGVKLLRIGTNRAVVEHLGARHELTLFSGLGGEALLQDPEDPRPDPPSATTAKKEGHE